LKAAFAGQPSYLVGNPFLKVAEALIALKKGVTPSSQPPISAHLKDK
jgi:hypothetical protein